MKWVTVSRRMGAQGSVIAKQVAGELGYPLYETEAIHRMAQELGVLESVRAVDEKVPSIFQRLYSHKSLVYLERLYSVIYELAKQGDAVFLGRGSHLLLREFPCTLHVRVTASADTCIRSLMGQGLTWEAATRALKRSDDERSAFVRYAFGVDWDDPTRYDLVLNMDKLSVTLAVSAVLHMVRSPALSDASAEALHTLAMLALARRAEAALSEATIEYRFAASLSVMVVAPGQIRLTGRVETEAQKANAESVLRAVKGVDVVENVIQVVPAFRTGV